MRRYAAGRRTKRSRVRVSRRKRGGRGRVGSLRSTRRNKQSSSSRLGRRIYGGVGSSDATVTTHFEYRADDVKNPDATGGLQRQFFTYPLSSAGTTALSPYTSRYEYYRIDLISIRFSPNQQKPLAGGTAPPPPVEFYTFIDRALGGTGSAEALVYSLPNRKAHSPYVTSYHTFKPNTLEYAYGGGTSLPTYVEKYGTWWPCTDTNAPHFGLSTFTVANSIRCTWGVHVRYKVSFKGLTNGL